MSLPSARAIAGALRSRIAHDTGGRSVGVGHRRRRPILRKLPLTSHLRSSGRAIETAVHRGGIARTIVCSGRVVARGHVLLRGQALTHAAVHRRIARAAGSQTGAVDGMNAHLGCPCRRCGARDYGAVLNRGRGPGDVRSHIYRAQRAVRRGMDTD